MDLRSSLMGTSIGLGLDYKKVLNLSAITSVTSPFASLPTKLELYKGLLCTAVFGSLYWCVQR